jgi:small subunit ribosomal protein S7e
MLSQKGKTDNTKKTDSNKVNDTVAKIFNDFAESSNENREEMKNVKIENVSEFKYEENKTFVLVNVNESGVKSLQRVHVDLVKRLESTLGRPVIVIPSRKTVDGKKYRKFIGKKVPRTKTLSYVRENLLEDLLFPATIVGKRTRYPRGLQKQLKVLVDPVDKEVLASKTSAICVGYKSLTGHELSIDFPVAQN